MTDDQGQEAKRITPGTPSDLRDTGMIGKMRLVLAISMLTSVILDQPRAGISTSLPWIACIGYVVHSTVLCILSYLNRPASQTRLIHWLDAMWFALIVFLTGGSQSFFFLAFFFAILTSSFRWGFEEGSRITIVSALLFALPALTWEFASDLSGLLLRTAFLLALGYMSAYWGESSVELKRQLALLRDVSQLSNPRFGVEHTLVTVLEKIRSFFNASSCMLVYQVRDTKSCAMHTVREGQKKPSLNADSVDMDVAAPLLALEQNCIFYYASWIKTRLRTLDAALAYNAIASKWVKRADELARLLGEVLEATSYITVPMNLKRGTGRVYVTTSRGHFGKADALFLAHIVEQTFPVIDNIEILDRMATEAALQERKKIALDIHDTAIQPYIGLRLGLSALLRKARPDNPLIDDIERLTLMAADKVDDLRRYAGCVGDSAVQEVPILLASLQRSVAQLKTFYGIDIAIGVENELKISDRLAAQALQIINEGLSNICKHTVAQSGRISIACADGWLRICIENDAATPQAELFMPRSIAERAAVLGGKTQVTQVPHEGTAVHIDIPV